MVDHAPPREGFTLSQASLAMRLMTTLFLVGIAGGIVAAQLNLIFHVGDEDGVSGPPSIRDVQYHFAGNPNESRLAHAISPGGEMADFIDDEGRERIFAWIANGVPEGEYEQVIRPIIDNNCMRCHEDAEGEHQPILHVHSEIIRHTEPGHGMSVSELALLTHQHALGMTVFYVLLGLALWLTHVRESIKLVGMTLPILGTILDLGAWWLTALVSPGFAALVMIGGLMQGIGVIPCLLGPLWEMWMRRAG